MQMGKNISATLLFGAVLGRSVLLCPVIWNQEERV
jgi:hypothetical protein